MNKFSDFNLNKSIDKAINIFGYQHPTPVQKEAIPQILSGKDVIICAQTGTGKTAAYLLPILNQLTIQEVSRKTHVLILAPTRELADQIYLTTKQLAKFLPFSATCLVGGLPYAKQIRELSKGVNIIIATPGRLLDHLKQKRLDLQAVKMLVLDEADRMLDMGFINDVTLIAKQTPAKRQTLLISATFDKQLSSLVSKLLNNPININLSVNNVTKTQIDQVMYRVSIPQNKKYLLNKLLSENNIYKAIIFSATKRGAEKLADEIEQNGHAAGVLHGDLRQSVRNRTLSLFKKGNIQFLVATDVASRGLDVEDISHVINYDLPRFSEDYVHRIGRTGRAGKNGQAISFVLPTETKHLRAIEKFVGKKYILKSDGNKEEGGAFIKDAKEQRSFRKFKKETINSYQTKKSKPARKFSKAKNDNEGTEDKYQSAKKFSKNKFNEKARQAKKSNTFQKPRRKFKPQKTTNKE